jgi:xanthine dehydrogenase YagT iron-sulfur-binding subunit
MATKNDNEKQVSRRGFLQGIGGTLAATAVGVGGVADATEAEAASSLPTLSGSVPVALTVNGKKVAATVDLRRTLLEMLRTDLDLTGTKKVCDRGACGACTVVLNGKTVFSCTTLAIDADGATVETIEGLEKNGKLHPIQDAFIRHDALMCGFCTPGFLISCKNLLDHNAKPSLEQIKEACCGNLCRCGAYPNIFDAVLTASGQETMANAKQVMASAKKDGAK